MSEKAIKELQQKWEHLAATSLELASKIGDRDATIAYQAAQIERLINAVQNWLAAIDEYRAFLKRGEDVNSATGVQYAIALDFREADLRAALQPKEGE